MISISQLRDIHARCSEAWQKLDDDQRQDPDYLAARISELFYLLDMMMERQESMAILRKARKKIRMPAVLRPDRCQSEAEDESEIQRWRETAEHYRQIAEDQRAEISTLRDSFQRHSDRRRKS